MMPLTVPDLAINADGTSYQTSGGLTDKVQILYDPLERVEKKGPLKVMAVKGSTLTAFFIKFYMCITAMDVSAPPVYIIADDNMEEGTINYHEVPGLGIGTHILSTGWVVFSKTRSVNQELYRWWFSTVFTKFVSDIRILNQIPLTTPAYFTLDGEDVQIKPLRTTEVGNMCLEHNIVIGKLPASTTSIYQPCDVGTCFMAFKTKKRDLRISRIY